MHAIVTSPEDYLYISAKDYTGENGQINVIFRMIQVFKSAEMFFSILKDKSNDSTRFFVYNR